MPGVRALRRIQVGKETTDAHGTAVAATARLVLDGTWEDLAEWYYPDGNTGYISGKDLTFKLSEYAHIAMEGDMTFEQLPYILEGGVSIVTPTTDTGSGYIYTYTFPTTAQNEVRTFTIEAGDDNAEEESAYCHVQSFTLSGAAKEAWKVSADWYGRQIVDTDSFTASTDAPAPTTLESCLFQKSKLYIDADTDTIGTTQKSNTLLDAELSVNTGWMPVWTGDGNKYFSFIKQSMPEVVLKITFEHDSTAVAEKTAWRAGTARLIQLLVQGTALSSSGAYTFKSVIINLAGKWEKFDALGDRDGNDIVSGTFRARYNDNSGRFAQIIVVMDTASLP